MTCCNGAPPTPTTPMLQAHHYAGLEPGPRLIVLGAVHGNETCGTRAIERMRADLDAGRWTVQRGALTLVPVANPLAYARGTRMGEPSTATMRGPSSTTRPRNRPPGATTWPSMTRRAVIATAPPAAAAGWARRSRTIRGPARAGGDGGAGDSDDGDARYGIGTTEYMRSQGGYGVTLECGSHDDPAAPDVGYRAIRQAVALLGLAPLPLAPPARRRHRPSSSRRRCAWGPGGRPAGLRRRHGRRAPACRRCRAGRAG